MSNVYIPMIAGSPVPRLDLFPYLAGDGRLYEVRHAVYETGEESGSTFQTQYAPDNIPGGLFHWYQTKTAHLFDAEGNRLAEWEEFYATDTAAASMTDYIYRNVDTSPGNGLFYQLIDHEGTMFSRWCPRRMVVGEIYERNPLVLFRRKDNCEIFMEGTHQTWLRFTAREDLLYTPAGGIEDVIVLDWITQLATDDTPEHIEERYWYARGFGLVAWGNNKGGSTVVEFYAPGARPDNRREVINCL